MARQAEQDDLRATITRMTAERDEAIAENDGLRQQVVALQNQMFKERNAFADLEAHTKHLEVQNEKLTDAIAELEAQLGKEQERKGMNDLADRIEAGLVKALSIKQPYPHHIFYNGKDVENRDWATKGRGWVIIHAGVSKSEIDMGAPTEADLPRGGIVGMMKIIDCVDKMDSEWFFGKFGFVIGDKFPLPLIPCRGQLGFFMPPPDILARVAAAIRSRAPVKQEG